MIFLFATWNRKPSNFWFCYHYSKKKRKELSIFNMYRITIENSSSIAAVSVTRVWFDDLIIENKWTMIHALLEEKELVEHGLVCRAIFDSTSISRMPEYSFTITPVLVLLVLPRSRDRKVSWRNQVKAVRALFLPLHHPLAIFSESVLEWHQNEKMHNLI